MQVRGPNYLLGNTVESSLRSIRPPELGSIVVRGDDVGFPSHFDFGPSGVRWARDVSLDVTELDAGRSFDFAFLARVLGGLIAILLGVETINSARQEGIFQAWSALGTSPQLAVVGRIFGTWASAVFGMAIIFGAGLVVGISASTGNIAELTLLLARAAVPTTLYLGAFIVIGVTTTIWIRRQGMATLAGLALWIGMVMFSPQAVALVSRTVFPDRLRAAMESRRDDAFVAAVRFGEDALGGALVASVGDVPPEEMNRAIGRLHSDLERVWTAHARKARQAAISVEQSWKSTRIQQREFEQIAELLTPAGALDQAMRELSNTGTAMTTSWVDAIEAEQVKLNQWLFDDRPRLTIRAPSGDTRQLLGFQRQESPTLSKRPVFIEPDISAWRRWQAASGALLALGGHILAVGLLGIIVARRLVHWR